MWERADRWPDGGDVWSRGWGGPESQWTSWMLPRLRVAAGDPPFGRIVEIGSGHGRWTQFLAGWSSSVVAVDLAPRCVEACRTRFADVPAVAPVLGDGTSLPGVGDRSVDLVFSFDSLVHADAQTITSYLAETGRVLTDDGVAFLHHSNLGACRLDRIALLRRWRLVHRVLAAVGVVERDLHWRDATVDADLVVDVAARHGLAVRSQELVRWGTRRAYIDCISVVTRSGSPAAGELHRFRNAAFDVEMAAAHRAASVGPVTEE